MSKTIDIVLEYNNKGETLEKKFTIKKVFHWAIEDHSEIQDLAIDVDKKWKEVKRLSSELSNDEKDVDKFYERREKAQKEINRLTDEIRAIGSSDFFSRRVKLAKGILEDNGIDDADMLNEDFWYKQVEPDQLMIFLAKVIYKDVDFSQGDKGGK